MKNIFKTVALFVVGLAVAIIIYPTMHELSHSVIAIMVGAKVMEINLFPLPNVLCDVTGVDNTGIVLIGLSGMTIPFLVSAVIKPKSFWVWYANYVLKGINFLAFTIAIISSIDFIGGKPLPNDDLTQILVLWSDGQLFCLMLSVGMTIFSICKLISEKPLVRCYDYFVKTRKTASAA